MNQNFSPLLTIRFRHKYFQDELFRSLKITFPQPVLKLFKDLGIISKPFPGGVQFYCSDLTILQNLDRNQRITCYLNSNDPYFINYTDLIPYKIKSNILYFNNLEGFINDDDESEYILHRNEFADNDEVFQVCNGLVDLNKYKSDSDFEFKDVFGENLEETEVARIHEKQNKYQISILDEAPLFIYLNNKAVQRLYVHTDQLWKKPFAVAEIFLSQLQSHLEKNKKISYSVNFRCRQTLWKYFMVSPEFKKYKKLSIINKATEPVFTEVIEKNKKQDSKPWVFISNNEIPLSENYDISFQLVDQLDLEKKTYKPVIKNLVTASAEQLFRKPKENEEAVENEETVVSNEGKDMQGNENTGIKETMYSHIYI